MAAWSSSRGRVLMIGSGLVCVAGVLLQCLFPSTPYGGVVNGLVKFYCFPLTIASGTVFLLLLAEKNWGLQLTVGRWGKPLAAGVLLLVTLWYLGLITNYLGPISLPRLLADSEFLSMEVFQGVSGGITAYQGTLASIFYGIGLYQLLRARAAA